MIDGAIEVPPEQEQAYWRAMYLCLARYPVADKYLQPLTDEQWTIRYMCTGPNNSCPAWQRRESILTKNHPASRHSWETLLLGVQEFRPATVLVLGVNAPGSTRKTLPLNVLKSLLRTSSSPRDERLLTFEHCARLTRRTARAGARLCRSGRRRARQQPPGLVHQPIIEYLPPRLTASAGPRTAGPAPVPGQWWSLHFHGEGGELRVQPVAPTGGQHRGLVGVGEH